MEHRCNARKPHRCEVLVDIPRKGLARMQSSNIGVGGIFIDTSATKFTANTAVTVALRLSVDRRRVEFCFPALVVRVTPAGGAAMMFLDTDAPTLDLLERALREMPDAYIHPDLVLNADSVAGKTASSPLGRVVNG